MSWQYPRWTPALSNRRGFAIWDLFYTRWGDITLGIGNGFFPDPATDRGAGQIVLPNYHGIAIGSRSTVERVMIQTQLVADVQPVPGLIPLWVDGRRIIDYQACHIGMPLRGQVLGPVTVHADEVYTTATTYIPDDGVGTPTLLVNNRFEPPALHLQFLQRNQDISLLNGPRMPMFRQGSRFELPADEETLVAIYPIGGRRSVTFQAHVSAGTADFRLGVLGAKQGSTDPYIEKTLMALTGVTGTAPGYANVTGAAQFLCIYCTPTGDVATFNYTLTCTDDCCGEAGTDGTPGGGGESFQTFERVIAQPADGSDFVVTLPVPMTTVDYGVWPGLAGASPIVGIDCPDVLVTDRTLTDFRVVTTAAMNDGEKIDFLVAPFTSP
jgi:hypothetical protein